MEVRYHPPLKRGISAILARYPIKTRQMGTIPPSAILSRKGFARYGGVSRTVPLRLGVNKWMENSNLEWMKKTYHRRDLELHDIDSPLDGRSRKS